MLLIFGCILFVLYCLFTLCVLPHSLQMFSLVRLEKVLSEVFE